VLKGKRKGRWDSPYVFGKERVSMGDFKVRRSIPATVGADYWGELRWRGEGAQSRKRTHRNNH